MSNRIIKDANEIADGINKAADNPDTPTVAAVVKPKLSAKWRRRIYNVGVGLGVVATAGGIVAASLDGQPALLTASVSGVALAVSNLIAKSHIAD